MLQSHLYHYEGLGRPLESQLAQAHFAVVKVEEYNADYIVSSLCFLWTISTD